METEILNIDYHTRRLILLAMNRHRRIKKAAQALGISERWLLELRHRYQVRLNEQGIWCAPLIKIINPSLQVGGSKSYE